MSKKPYGKSQLMIITKLQAGILSAIAFVAVAQPLALGQPAQVNQVGQPWPMSLQSTHLPVGNEAGTNLATPAGRLAAEADELGKGLALYLPLTTDLKDHSPATLPIKVAGGVHLSAEGAVFGGEDWLEAPHIALNDRPFAIAFWMRDTTASKSCRYSGVRTPVFSWMPRLDWTCLVCMGRENARPLPPRQGPGSSIGWDQMVQSINYEWTNI